MKGATHLTERLHVFFETDKDDIKTIYKFSSKVKCIINISQLFYTDINCCKLVLIKPRKFISLRQLVRSKSRGNHASGSHHF